MTPEQLQRRIAREREARKQAEKLLEEKSLELYLANEELKQLASDLVTKEQKTRAVINHAADGFFLHDAKGTILEVNQRACESLGYTRRQLLVMNMADIETTLDKLAIAQMVASLQPLETKTIEGEHRRSDGSVFPVEVRVRQYVQDEQTVILALVRDISARKAAEMELLQKQRQLSTANQQLRENQAQLVQSEKMASIGQLAAGVAHEINNPMGFIKSNLTCLSEYITDMKRMIAMADEIAGEDSRMTELRSELDLDYLIEDSEQLIKESIEGASRVNQIVGDLREFSHVDSPDVTEVDVNHLINKTLNIANNELKYKCTVSTHLGDLPLIRAHGGKLGQVFLNLFINAAQAMDEFGKLHIHTTVTGDQVTVSVEDTGRGMSEELQSKIFDPFFTTKPVGEGTGLGLHLAQKIVRGHNGRIAVRSTPGVGTTFIVILPVHNSVLADQDLTNG